MSLQPPAPDQGGDPGLPDSLAASAQVPHPWGEGAALVLSAAPTGGPRPCSPPRRQWNQEEDGRPSLVLPSPPRTLRGRGGGSPHPGRAWTRRSRSSPGPSPAPWRSFRRRSPPIRPGRAGQLRPSSLSRPEPGTGFFTSWHKVGKLQQTTAALRHFSEKSGPVSPKKADGEAVDSARKNSCQNAPYYVIITNRLYHGRAAPPPSCVTPTSQL